MSLRRLVSYLCLHLGRSRLVSTNRLSLISLMYKLCWPLVVLVVYIVLSLFSIYRFFSSVFLYCLNLCHKSTMFLSYQYVFIPRQCPRPSVQFGCTSVFFVVIKISKLFLLVEHCCSYGMSPTPNMLLQNQIIQNFSTML